MTSLRVGYIGAFSEDYPRHLIIRRGLERHGAKVLLCNAPNHLNTAGRTRWLLKHAPEIVPHCDVLILAAFGQPLFPVAFYLAKRYRKRLLVDAFISVYQTAAEDRKTVSKRSLAALRYRLFDWAALMLSDRVITDTRQHMDYFTNIYRIRSSKFRVVPVGASAEWLDMSTNGSQQSETLIQFYGTYIPLHGIEFILQAAQRLSAVPGLRFELIGNGQMYSAMRELADGLGLPDTIFRDSVPSDQLPKVVARADICLGIFGTTEKAQRVVPNPRSLTTGRSAFLSTTGET